MTQSILQSNTDECLVCGSQYALAWHHVFMGNPSRALSEEYGLKVRLCLLHHTGTYGVHGKYGHAFDLKLKRLAQSAFELAHTRKEFMALFGKNYL